ncbi:Uncharacterised protein [Candidatus Anstonella stagnisolia]|nr:Uncharacterised protein [Candidatus Anstonella stagnisolia]
MVRAFFSLKREKKPLGKKRELEVYFPFSIKHEAMGSIPIGGFLFFNFPYCPPFKLPNP